MSKFKSIFEARREPEAPTDDLPPATDVALEVRTPEALAQGPAEPAVVMAELSASPVPESQPVPITPSVSEEQREQKASAPRARAAKRGLENSTNQGAATTAAERRPGRPNGKRSDPEFIQVSAWVRKSTHRDVKIALLQEAEGREFSELVEDLLKVWLDRH